MTDTTNNNTPNPSAGDPDLTAFALGELQPGSDIYEQIKARLETDADARAFVEQTRALGKQLQASYQAEGADASGLLDHQQKELSAMIDQQDKPDTKPNTATKPIWLSRPALLAAGLALAAGAAFTTITLMDREDNSDIVTPPERPGLASGTAEVSERLALSIPVEYTEMPLGELFASLSRQINVAIDTDWEALSKRGVHAETLVTLQTDEPVPAAQVLSAALQAAWFQSKHPDPAQWAINDKGVTVAPQSALVQARLDATAALLEGNRLSKGAVDTRFLEANKAEVWESDLWNRMMAQRAAAADAVLAEADAALTAAEAAVRQDDFNQAIERGAYAYRLLGMHDTVLESDDFKTPVQRIADLQQAIDEGKVNLAKAEIKASAQDTTPKSAAATEYEAAMVKAVQDLEKQDFLAASNSVIEARVVLSKQREQFDEETYEAYLSRSVLLMSLIQTTQRRTEAQQLARIEQDRSQMQRQATSEAERRRNEQIQRHLKNARQAQLNKDYDKALVELEAASFLEPENEVISSLRGMIKDTSIAAESFELKRGRDLEIASQTLMNIEATTPYGHTLNYPGGSPDAPAFQGAPGFDLNDALVNTASGGGRNGEALWRRQTNLSGLYLQGGQGQQAQQQMQQQLAGGQGNLKKYSENVNEYFGRLGAAQQQQQGQQGRQFWFGRDQPIEGRLGSTFTIPGNAGGTFSLGAGVQSEAGTFGAIGLTRTEQRVLLRRVTADQALQPPPAPPSFTSDLPSPEPAAPVRTVGRTDAPDEVAGTYIVPQQQQTEWPLIKTSRRAHYDQLIERHTASVEEDTLTDADRQHLAELKLRRDLAVETEPLELKRIEAIQQLGELNQTFIERCRPALEVDPRLSRDSFALVNDNPFYDPANPGRAQSTFSVDVDTAAYTIARRQLIERSQLPVPEAVRIEEMINYFDYGYTAPVVDRDALEDGVVTQASLEAYEKKHEGFAPFATHIQVTDCPWQAGNQLVRIGIKGMEVAQEDRPAAHLTFLLDVSGSMNSPNKLGLVKDSLKMLMDKLNDHDHVSIVVYAGASGLVLENVPATDRAQIEGALDRLRAGGSTAGAAGIQLAYDTAQKHYIDGGVNRVILCTDGDFNVGISGTDALVDLIKSKANPEADADGKRRGVYLSVFGYGMGNLNDAMMEPLTNAGNGTYAYVDTIREATKVMYDQAGASLITIAKDVKVQVQFDPDQVMAYRLIGYENRVLANQDFANDKVDAGDIGAGHSVTALYEVVPFPDEDDFGGEGFFEVRQRLEDLHRAVALNQSLMQTASLSHEQTVKLLASTRMIEQEIMLVGAVAHKLDDDKPEAEAVEPLEDGAMLAVRLRYKPVDAPAEDGTSRLIETSVFADEAVPFAAADDSTRFAASVASFAMQLRSSPHAGDADLAWALDTAEGASAHDPGQFKAELLELIEKTKELMPE